MNYDLLISAAIVITAAVTGYIFCMNTKIDSVTDAAIDKTIEYLEEEGIVKTWKDEKGELYIERYDWKPE